MTTETKIAVLETFNSQVSHSLKRIEDSFKQTEDRFSKKFDNIDTRLDRIDNRMWSIMLGLVACFGATLISITLHALGFV